METLTTTELRQAPARRYDYNASPGATATSPRGKADVGAPPSDTAYGDAAVLHSPNGAPSDSENPHTTDRDDEHSASSSQAGPLPDQPKEPETKSAETDSRARPGPAADAPQDGDGSPEDEHTDRDGKTRMAAPSPESDTSPKSAHSLTPAESPDEENNASAVSEGELEDGPKAEANLPDYVQLMEARLALLEQKVRQLDGRGSDRSDEDDADDASRRVYIYDRRKRRAERKPAIPELRYVKWREFKTRYVDADVYAIDVLSGEARYWYQRRNDEWARKFQASIEPVSAPTGAAASAAAAAAAASPTANEAADSLHAAPASEQLPERIRINSWPLLTILSNICAEDWSMMPHVILRPYKLLVEYESEIREVFRRLKDKWATKESAMADGPENQGAAAAADVPDGDAPGTAGSTPNLESEAEKPGTAEGDDDGQAQDESPAAAAHLPESKAPDDGGAPKNLMDCEEAYHDMACLIAFMDKHLTPVLEQFRNRTRRRIHFHELWYLFKPGDILYAPKKPDTARSKKEESDYRYQTAFKLLRMYGGRPLLSRPTGNQDETNPPLKDRIKELTICGYYVDYGGENFGPIVIVMDIQPFDGQRDITSLEVFPLAYADNHTAIYGQLKARGDKFLHVLNHKHVHYVGSTYTSNPNGTTSDDDDKIPQHINSEVIVDFVQSEEMGLGLTYTTSLGYIEKELSTPPPFDDVHENYPLAVHISRSDTAPASADDTVCDDHPLETRRCRRLIATDPFLRAVAELDAKVRTSTRDALRADDVALLPSRVIGYVLRERRFALLDVQHANPIAPNPDGFRHLQLPTGHRDMVQALVRSHSMKSETAAQASFDYDIVKGKGQGLIILLHGVPGVGKTSTAECVAQSTGKPLFPITCGDLGLTPEDVEKRLRDIFCLAQAWDCILLLDEADVFLAQRTKTDLKRNALVSVFLRVLEYYRGILFLTTNRVGAFDEAFKSRIHISLYYPELSRRQARKIWEANLERTRKIDRERAHSRTVPALRIDAADILAYADEHYTAASGRAGGVGKWNGRQIRNAFQTATAIALYEAHAKNKKRLDAAAAAAAAANANANADDSGADADPDADVGGSVELVPPRLQRKHFVKVAHATEMFDEYMEEVVGRDDVGAAYARGDRADHFRPTSTLGGHRAQRQQTYPVPAGAASAGAGYGMPPQYMYGPPQPQHQHQHQHQQQMMYQQPMPPATPLTQMSGASGGRQRPMSSSSAAAAAGVRRGHDSPTPVGAAAYVQHNDIVEHHHTRAAWVGDACGPVPAIRNDYDDESDDDNDGDDPSE